MHEHRPVFECLARRRAKRLRRVVCTDRASKEDDFRERILPTGGVVLLRLRLGGSATCLQRETRVRQSAVRPRIKKRNGLCAAQLTLAPDKAPNAAPAGRAGLCSARRTASRRLQVTPSEPLFSRGKRRAACPLSRGCALRVNRLTVSRTSISPIASSPRPYPRKSCVRFIRGAVPQRLIPKESWQS